MPPQNTPSAVTSRNKEETDRNALPNGKKRNIDSHNEEVPSTTAAIIVPPDGGWAWVVMVASFLCNTVVDGIVFSSGMIQKDIILDFKVSEGYVALVSSLLSGFYLMAGPFVSAAANRYGFRLVTIAGAIIAALAFGLSYFATSIEFLFITYGIIGGIGFCLIYIPSVITIGYYFERWRALATGIALCGSGVGTFIFAPLTNFLINQTGWRGALAIQAIIILSCALYGCAFRPIQPIQLAVCDIEEKLDKTDEKPLVDRTRFTNRPTKPLPEGRFAYSVPNSAHNTYMGAAPNHHYPTAADIFRGANLERRLSLTGPNTKGTELKNIRKYQPTTAAGESAHHNFNLNKELTTVGENEEESIEGQNLLCTESKSVPSSARRHTVSGRRPGDVNYRSNNNLKQNILAEARPMYRDDIFFTGSLVRIPQYVSQTSLGYHMSVTRLPTTKDLTEEKETGCRMCSEAVRRTLSTMLDTSLLKSPSFMLLAASGFLTMMGFFVPFIFIVRRAQKAGMDESTALLIISAIGITNTIARIVCGLLSSFKGISALHLNNIAITAGGIATIFSGYIINETTQFVYAAIFGICIACFSALRSIIAVELMGLEKLTNAFGFLMLFQGLAAALGSPIAGVFYDMTGSYDASFYFAGILITISAILCYPLNYVNRWEKQRQNNKREEIHEAI